MIKGMVKGARIEATNTQMVGTSTTVYNMIGIPDGKTFILTDLVVTATYAADHSITEASNDLFKLYDFSGDGATAASGNGAAYVSLNLPLKNIASFDRAAAIFNRETAVLRFTNGPEFSTGVTPGMGAGNAALIGTGCVWVAGILR